MRDVAADTNPSPAFNVDEAAAWARLSRATLYRLMDAGELRSVKIGRRRLIMRNDLSDLLQAKAA